MITTLVDSNHVASYLSINYDTLDKVHKMKTMISYVGPKFEEQDPSSCRASISKFEQALNARVNLHHDIQSLFSEITNARSKMDIICIDLEYLHDIEGMSMFDTIRTLDGLLRLNRPQAYIVGIAGHDTNADVIRESLQVPEIRTIAMRLGGPWTFEMVLADVRKYMSGDYGISPEIKRLIEPAKKKNIKLPSISLTARQAQVLNLITTRGASNKVIAKTLKISESTVKLHMSAILKKYGCRNRTQLAVFNRDRVKTLAGWLLFAVLGSGAMANRMPDIIQPIPQAQAGSINDRQFLDAVLTTFDDPTMILGYNDATESSSDDLDYLGDFNDADDNLDYT